MTKQKIISTMNCLASTKRQSTTDTRDGKIGMIKCVCCMRYKLVQTCGEEGPCTTSGTKYNKLLLLEATEHHLILSCPGVRHEVLELTVIRSTSLDCAFESAASRSYERIGLVGP